MIISHRRRTGLLALVLLLATALSAGTVAHLEGKFLSGNGMTVYSGVQAAAATAGGGSPNSARSNASGQSNGHNTFTITGVPVTGLFPGAGYPIGTSSQRVYIYLTVTNPNNQNIRVTSLSYSVGDAGAGCTRANLAPTTETVSFSVVVPKNSSVGGRTFALPLSMVPTAPNACQTAHFPLTLTGSAIGPA